ncbi:MAG: LysR family transcriptional regulator [Alphaproteobacteria bacterium]|nr:LysR family transcriptional regulator [Alphaproteobacteria bacterium]
MRRKIPPLNALLAFEAAARHCNFTRAAEELSVAQPAVTRHVANIEDWVGADLFKRRGSNLDLTEQGQALAELATTVFDRLELGVRDVVAANDQELLLGASFGVTHLWLMPRIGGLRMAANATINFITSDDYRGFDAPAVDASIRFGNGDFGSNGCDLIFRETCQIIASPGFLAAHPEFDPEDPTRTLDLKYMFDHGDPHAIGWTTWADFFRRDGRSLEETARLTTVLSYPTMLDMVCAGEGIGLGYWGLEDALVEAGKLVRAGTPIARENFGYYLVYRREQRSKPAFERLRAFLLQCSP